MSQLDDLDDIPALWLSRRLLLFSFISRARLFPLEKQRMTIQSNKQTRKEKKEAGVGQLCYLVWFSLCLCFFPRTMTIQATKVGQQPFSLLLRYCCGRVIPPVCGPIMHPCVIVYKQVNPSLLRFARRFSLPPSLSCSLSVSLLTPFFFILHPVDRHKNT